MMSSIITCSSDEKLAKAQALGADHLVNYRQQPEWVGDVLTATAGGGVDLVVETVGGDNLNQSLEALRSDGHISVVGFLGGMQAELGDRFEVIENGLNNRTTNLDYPDPIGIVAGEAFNGARTLPGLLAAHAPLDLVVIMLGSNDLRAPFWRTADESAAAIAQLINIVKSSDGSVANTYDAPQLLIVAPPRIGSMPHAYFAERFSGAEQVSKGFADAYRTVAEEAEIPFLDATEAIGVTNGWDGIHISAEQHQRLGSAIASDGVTFGFGALFPKGLLDLVVDQNLASSNLSIPIPKLAKALEIKKT